MSKKYKVNIFTRAKLDIYNITEYWVKTLKVSPSPFIDDYEKAIINLAEFPFAHHQPNDKSLREKGYRIFPVKNYYIFYVVIEDEVQIHRVLYNKMDFTKLF